MSVCRVRSLSLFGIDALPVEVEVDVSAGLPGFSIVGLPDAAVQEARERVRVAISNSGYKFPTKKVIVNLAPAGWRREGGAFDLPMALGIMASSGMLPPACLRHTGIVGELSLDGDLRGVRGALSMAEPWSEDEAGPEGSVEDFADVAGQAYAKRALEVAAAGGHNVFTLFWFATPPPTGSRSRRRVSLPSWSTSNRVPS